MAIETIGIYNEETKSVITIYISASNKFEAGRGFWDIDTNQILLSMELWWEWSQYTGHVEKQKLFLDKLTKISKNAIA
jgi:hypothetical protein